MLNLISDGYLKYVGERYKDLLRVIFDPWPKLNLGLNVQAEIQIFNKSNHYIPRLSYNHRKWNPIGKNQV